jgi:hypothetical protein
MSGYIPLVSRLRGACRCPICSADSEIVKFYVDDVLCKFDSELCENANDLGVRVCFIKRGGRRVRCSRFVSKGF